MTTPTGQMPADEVSSLLARELAAANAKVAKVAEVLERMAKQSREKRHQRELALPAEGTKV